MKVNSPHEAEKCAQALVHSRFGALNSERMTCRKAGPRAPSPRPSYAMGPGTDYIGRLTLRMIMCFCQEARAKMRKGVAFQEVSGPGPFHFAVCIVPRPISVMDPTVRIHESMNRPSNLFELGVSERVVSFGRDEEPRSDFAHAELVFSKCSAGELSRPDDYYRRHFTDKFGRSNYGRTPRSIR